MMSSLDRKIIKARFVKLKRAPLRTFLALMESGRRPTNYAYM
jgi:hypothetical protein